MSASRPTLDQCRASHAWKAVEQARALKGATEYAREAKRLPVRIKTSSLGQAAAFLNAKAGPDKEDARAVLLTNIGNWLIAHRKLAAAPSSGIGRDAVIKMIVNGDARLLRRATEEALLYLQWLTRFCEAEIDGDTD